MATSLPRWEAGALTPTSCPLAWASLVAAGESVCFRKAMNDGSLAFSLSGHTGVLSGTGTLPGILQLEKVILVVVECE